MASRILDTPTQVLVDSARRLIERRYGDHLAALHLFGSRARGDHRADSDADLALFLDAVPDPLGEQLVLVDELYDLVLDTGINIQTWVFDARSLSDPAWDKAAHLVARVCAEGIRV